MVHEIQKSGRAWQYSGDAPVWSSFPYRRQAGMLTGLYDKVLVDVQCTHDGSIKHIRKHMETDWRNFDARHYNELGLQDLYELQYGLIVNGFRLLKPNGLIVYSTCSLSRNQNETILERFIKSHGEAIRIEEPVGDRTHIVGFEGGVALRVPPSVGTGGGFFLCRIRKLG